MTLMPMLSSRNRLRGKDLFQRLFSDGRRVFVGSIGGFSLPVKDDTLVLGVTFKQKAFPKAVTRHWYKRRTLAWVRGHMAELPAGRAIVVHFQKPLPVASFAKLSQALSQLFHSLKSL